MSGRFRDPGFLTRGRSRGIAGMRHVRGCLDPVMEGAEENRGILVSLNDSGPEMEKLQKTIRTYYNYKDGCVKDMPLMMVEDLLSATEEEMPKLKPGTKGLVRISHDRSGPSNFFLQWEAQQDRLDLIHLNLKGLAAIQDLVPINMSRFPEDKLLQKLVAAPRRMELVRGFVSNFVDQGRTKAKIYSLDYGDNQDINIKSLYVLPEQIGFHSPLCFSACLQIERTATMEEKRAIRAAAKGIIREEETYFCEILGVIVEESVSVMYVVELWKVSGDDQEIYRKNKSISEEIREITRRNLVEVTSQATTSALTKLPPYLQISSIFSDSDVSIAHYTDTNLKGMNRFRATNVISPGEFYLQLPYADGCCGWYNELVKFYQSKVSYDHNISAEGIQLNRCYVWHDVENNNWYRVRAVEDLPCPDGQFTKAKLWLVDEGNFAIGFKADMKELRRDFTYPARALRVYLVHVTYQAIEFGPDEMQKFLELLKFDQKGVLFNGVIQEVAEVEVPYHRITFDSKAYGMILSELEKNSKLCSGTLQSVLVRNNLMLPDGPASGRHDLAFIVHKEPSYSKVDFEKALGIKITNLRAAKNSKAPVMVESNTHIPTKPHLFEIYNQIHPDKHPNGFLSIGMRRKLSSVKISSAERPDNFCIQMERKCNELFEMEMDMELVQAELPIVVTEDILPGFIGVGKLKGTSLPSSSFWARVCILSTDIASNRGWALLIDHGEERPVILSSLKKLPQYLLDIPPFCQRAHLDFSGRPKCIKTPVHVEWNDKGCWRRCIGMWNAVGIIYYAWQWKPHDESTVIALEEFGQELNFNHATATWYTGKLQKKLKYVALKALREHPLLRQFFVSVGVDLHYEEYSESPAMNTLPMTFMLESIGQINSLEE